MLVAVRSLPIAIVCLAIAIPAAFVSLGAAAQTGYLKYDTNGDNKGTCADFEFREDATAAMNNFPTELGKLDNNNDGIACESLPSRASGSNPSKSGKSGKSGSGSGAGSTSGSGRTPPPVVVTPPPVAPPPLSSGGAATPQEILDAVAGCAAVAIGPHGVAASGCPGGRNVTIRLPADAPPLSSAAYTQWAMPLAVGSGGAAGNASTGGTRSSRADRAGKRGEQARGDRRKSADSRQSTDDERPGKHHRKPGKAHNKAKQRR
ncbi:MAG: hypothetical protein IT337_02930 [Thermomicrobiales bacterium]|nr:hypothetical protein [Thermomicrobiales bacterium]